MDLAVRQIEERKCPGDALGDIWIAAGRVAVHPIKAHEFVFYHEVIPPTQWRKWLTGDSTGGEAINRIDEDSRGAR